MLIEKEKIIDFLKKEAFEDNKSELSKNAIIYVLNKFDKEFVEEKLPNLYLIHNVFGDEVDFIIETRLSEEDLIKILKEFYMDVDYSKLKELFSSLAGNGIIKNYNSIYPAKDYR